MVPGAVGTPDDPSLRQRDDRGLVGGSDGLLAGVLVAVVGTLLIVLVSALVGGGGVVSALFNPALFGLALGGVMLALLFSLLLSIPLLMALWFSPALVLFNGMPPWQALRASFDACLQNALPFLLYGLIITVLAFFATLPMLLGYLVLIPLIAGSVYAAYRDIFLAD